MKKKIFALTITILMISVVAWFMIGQKRVVLAHVEDSHIIDSQGGEKIGSLEREAIEARKRGFEINSVIVTMTREATRKFIDYTAENFADICCISVEDLTQDTVDYVRNVVKGKSNARSMMVDTDQFKRILRLELKEKSEESVLRAVEQLKKRSDILSAEPNYINYIGAIPNDTHYGHGDQWGLNGTNGINAPASWDISTGLSTVSIGVLDTGIQASHPDLVNRISSAGLHRDCTVYPITTVTTQNLNDPNGHGTHVAGIIGSQGNNSDGVAGVAWDVSLVSLRVFDANGSGYTRNIIRAIEFAASQNIPILNYSGGGSYNDPNLQNALAGYGGLFVTAAGNENSDVDETPHFPSDYANSTNPTYNDFSNRVISVGSIASNGERSSFSNYSNSGNRVTIYAPGTKILSTFPTNLCPDECGFLPIIFNSEHHANGYHYLSGTSMATPMVTGVAALLLSHNSSLTAAQLKDAIVVGATVIAISIPNPSGSGNVYRNVLRLNANNALRKVAYQTTSIGYDEIKIDGTYFTPTGSPTIPEKLNGRTVTQIGNSAFKGCASLGSITIPNSVTNIDCSAFENCSYLQSITLSNNLTSIGSSAFKGCASLGSITIPNSVTNIDSSAFENCSYLQNITLSTSLTCIGGSAFKGCEFLGSIT